MNNIRYHTSVYFYYFFIYFLMKKIILLFLSFWVLLGAWSSSSVAFSTLSQDEIQSSLSQWYILSDNHTDFQVCTSIKNQYNREYPKYQRSDCFFDGKWYKYFICYEWACVTSTQVLVSSSLSSSQESIASLNSTNIKASHQRQLDIFLQKVREQRNILQDDEKYEALLKSVWNKFTTLEKKYAKNATVLQMVTYLSNGVEELKVKYAQSWENDDIANFFKDLTLEDTEQVNEIASNEPKGSNTTTTTKNPSSSAATTPSTSTSIPTVNKNELLKISAGTKIPNPLPLAYMDVKNKKNSQEIEITGFSKDWVRTCYLWEWIDSWDKCSDPKSYSSTLRELSNDRYLLTRYEDGKWYFIWKYDPYLLLPKGMKLQYYFTDNTWKVAAFKIDQDTPLVTISNTPATSPTVVQEVLPGWSKVDGPRSKYPSTEEELKFICKEWYRLPTNAEWEALREKWAWDLFTKEAQKLWLSSAYYRTKEWDIFYVMNGTSGYLNPVKAEDKERIRNLTHYTRCISNTGANITNPVVVLNDTLKISAGSKIPNPLPLAYMDVKNKKNSQEIEITGFAKEWVRTCYLWEWIDSSDKCSDTKKYSSTLRELSNDKYLLTRYENGKWYFIWKYDPYLLLPKGMKLQYYFTDDTGKVAAVKIDQDAPLSSSSASMVLTELPNYVWQTLSKPGIFDTYLFAYNWDPIYSQLVQKFATLENQLSATVTKVEDHGNQNPITWTNREATRLSAPPTLPTAFWQDTAHFRNAVSAVANSLKYPEDGNLANEAYNAVENLKSKLYYLSTSYCPTWSVVFETWTSRQKFSKEKMSNTCVTWNRYFTLYFWSLPEPEKITKSYSVTSSVIQNFPNDNYVCQSTNQWFLFWKQAEWNFEYMQYVFTTDWQWEMDFYSRDPQRYGKCTWSQYQLPNPLKPWTHNSTDVWDVFEANTAPKFYPYISFYPASNVCIWDKKYATWTWDWFSKNSWSKLLSVKSIACYYKYTVQP